MHILEELEQGKDIPEAIKAGFQVADRILVEKSLSEGKWPDGSTAVVALVRGSTLYIANLGDTEACLVSVDRYKSGNSLLIIVGKEGSSKLLTDNQNLKRILVRVKAKTKAKAKRAKAMMMMQVRKSLFQRV